MLLHCLIIALLGPISASAGSQRPIEVQVGEPNLWTLEQAHYLLARMHATNDGLQTKFPDPDKLDPNALHGSRVDLLRTVVSGSVAFDQTVGVKNEFEVARSQGDLQRREALRQRLDAKRDQLLDVVGELTILEAERARLAAAGAEADVIPIAAQIAGKTAEKAVLETEVGSLTTELGTVTISPPDLGTASAPAGPGLPDEVLGTLVQSAMEDAAPPRLHASRVLDNFVQMQYEIIAKQLSLLKDETAPGHRLIFLELPQSVESVPSKAEKYLARTHWRATGLCQGKNREEHRFSAGKEAPDPLGILGGCRWLDVPGTVERSARHGLAPGERVGVIDLIPRQAALNVNAVHGRSTTMNLRGFFALLTGFGAGGSFERRRERLERSVQEEIFASGFGKGDRVFGWTFGRKPGEKVVAAGPRTTYAVLIVPEWAEAVRLEGQGCAYSRKRMPPPPFASGKDRSAWCGSPRSFDLLIPSQHTNGFWVDLINYSAVESGNRITVILGGRHFSPQTGVLVNGTPLRRVPAMTRELVAAGAPAAIGVEGIYEIVNSNNLLLAFSMGEHYHGTPVITLVTPGKLSPINYFPLCINKGYMTAENCKNRRHTLAQYSQRHPMFRQSMAIEGLRLIADGPVPIRNGSCDQRNGRPTSYTALLTGRGFRADDSRVYINGDEVCRPRKGKDGKASSPPTCEVLDSRELRFPLTPRSEPIWDVTVVLDSTQRQFSASKRFAHPLNPTVESYEVLRYDSAPRRPSRESAGRTALRVSMLDAVLRGRNLQAPIAVALLDGVAGEGQAGLSYQSLSPNELLIRLRDVEGPALLQLQRPCSQASTVVSLHPPEMPVITLVANSENGRQPKGLTTGGYQVEIHGAHLGAVRRVLFGSTPAPQVRASGSVVYVTAPAHAPGTVRVLVETDLTFAGSKLTNVRDFEDPQRAVFTFEAPPEKE